MITVEAAKIFTQDPQMGNLAGVVLDAAKLTDATMQQVAKIVNASETAFVLPSNSADFRLKWFTPTNEVGICIHATIGAIAAWLKANRDSRLRLSIETRNAVLNAEVDGGIIYINVPDYEIEERQVNQELVRKYFKIRECDLNGLAKVIKIYEDYELVVPLKSLAALERLEPNIESYAQACKELCVTGLSFFSQQTFDPVNHIHLREFAPLYGYLEDPLCGMAAGCVLTFLREKNSKIQELQIEQGHFCKTGGIIYVRFKGESGAWIGGKSCFDKTMQIESAIK